MARWYTGFPHPIDAAVSASGLPRRQISLLVTSWLSRWRALTIGPSGGRTGRSLWEYGATLRLSRCKVDQSIADPPVGSELAIERVADVYRVVAMNLRESEALRPCSQIPCLHQPFNLVRAGGYPSVEIKQAS